MPESKSRKKKAVTTAPQAEEAAAKVAKKAKAGNPVWLVPVMLGLMILGLLWVVIFYLTSSRTGGGFPIPSVHRWNLAIGFALIIAGFGLTTRWK